jgi:O-antigen/teichoic acid export membrane protein
MTETKLALRIALRSTGTAVGILFIIGFIFFFFGPYDAESDRYSKPLLPVLFILVFFFLFYRTSLQTINAVKQNSDIER